MSGGTSEFGYVVAVGASTQYQSQQPLDALSSRILLSNAMMLSDEAAQVRVAWGDSTGTAPTPSFPNTYVQLMSWIFPLTLRQSGDTYKLRIRLSGWVGGGATATLRAIVGTPNLAGPVSAWGVDGDRVFTTAALGASDAWLTGTTAGTASPDLLYLPAAQVSMQSLSTLATFGGDPAALSLPFAQLSIYQHTSSTGHPAVLTGVNLAEYVGT